MSRHIKCCFLIVLVFVSYFSYSSDIAYWKQEEQKARRLFGEGKYDEAVILFREIILSSQNEAIIREAYYWLSIAYINIGKYGLAEQKIDFYLKNYKNEALYYSEALYEKGRLLFLGGKFQDSIKLFAEFIELYPQNDKVSNAYYWMGEALFSMGQLDDSAFYFSIVIDKYSKSPKKTVCEYRLQLIEHRKTQIALQNLLKWSQEQYISTLNKLKIKEKSLEEAYKNFSKSSMDVDSKNDLQKLKAENQILQIKVDQLKEQINLLKNQNGNNSINDRLEQLQLREVLLNQKEEVLKMIEEELRKKENRLEK